MAWSVIIMGLPIYCIATIFTISVTALFGEEVWWRYTLLCLNSHWPGGKALRFHVWFSVGHTRLWLLLSFWFIVSHDVITHLYSSLQGQTWPRCGHSSFCLQWSLMSILSYKWDWEVWPFAWWPVKFIQLPWESRCGRIQASLDWSFQGMG